MNALPPHPKLAFLASHNGSSMRAMVAACRDGWLAARPVLLVSNNRDSAALRWAAENALATAHISATVTGSEDNADAALAAALHDHHADLVVLAGYMRKLGGRTLAAFRRRILNVHPALLPKFGGQGMHGARVHAAVLAAGERVTGVTIHLVDDAYDHGPVIAQTEVAVLPGDTAERLADRVQAREPTFFLEVLQRIINRGIDLDRL